MKSLLTTLAFAAALVTSVLGQAPPLVRNPFTTNVAGGGLTNLSDVRIERSTITDGEVLTWNNTAGKWSNSPSTGAGEMSYLFQASPTNATRASLWSSKVANTNYLRTIEGSNGITVNVMGGGTNLFITISDAELLVWAGHTTNTFVRTNDLWLLRFASNGVDIAAGTGLGVANVASGIQQIFTVSITDPELLVWATHTTNTFVRTNDLWLDRVASNRFVLAAGPGISISTIGVGTKQVNTISAVGGEGSVSSSNVTLYGSFGYLSRSDLVVLGYGTGNNVLTNYSSFSGSNFTGSAITGFITNGMPDGWVDIDASVNLVEDVAPSGNFHLNLQINGVTFPARVTIVNDGQQFLEYSLMATVYLLTNDTVSILVQNGDAQPTGILTSHLRVRSYNQIFTVVSGGGSPGDATLTGFGGVVIEDEGTNFNITVSNITSVSQSFTNLRDGATVAMAWSGPNIVRWGPTNNGMLTGGGTAPGAGDPAKTWQIEIYPGGYTNLVFPGAFTWVDGGPFYNPAVTNIIELKFTGSNYLAFTRPNGTLSAASANISGHWIAPPASGIIGGMNGGSQIRTNLLAANAMLIISNLVNETEVEIWSRGPVATISNANSIVWMEGSQPYINTNGRTLLRFWMADGNTNGMVLSQQIIDFVPGNDINFTTDIANNKITIHSTASGGSGGAGLVTGVDASQLEVNDGVLGVKANAIFLGAVNKGNFTVQPDDNGVGGGLGATYFSSFRYMDIGMTNLGSAHIVDMIWDGPGMIRWMPTNNGVLTGGGTAPQLGDPARRWEIVILPNGATNITWPGAFQWQDGGPYFNAARTNLYSILFTGSNYLARRMLPGFEDQIEQGTNVVLYTNPVTKRLVFNSAAAVGGGASGGTIGHRKLVEHFVGGNATNIGTYGWQAGTTGTTPARVGNNSDPGTVQLTTSGVLSNYSSIFLGPSGEFGTLTNYAWTNCLIVTFPGSTYFSNMTVRMGFTLGVNDFTNSASMIGLVVTNGSAVQGPGNWFGVNAVGSVETITNTGISSGTAQTFTNEIRSSGNGLIRFSVNGVESAAIGGGPSLTSLRPFFSITTTEAAAKAFNVQYWDFDWIRDYPGTFGFMSPSVTLSGLTLSNLTASRALIIDANKNITNSPGVTTTELEYLDGVTSAIQTQLDAKVNAATLPYVIREEFLGGTITSGSIGTHGWQALGLGMIALSKPGYYGIFRGASLSTSNQFNSLILGADGMVGGTLTNVAWTNKIIIGFPQGDTDSLSNNTLRVGWVAGANSVVNSNPPTDAIYLCVSNNFLAGTWFGILANGGTETIVNLGVTASIPATLMTNEVRCTGNGQITFAINGVASAAQNGASALGMRPFVTQVKTFAVADTSNKQFQIDYWEWAPVLPGR